MLAVSALLCVHVLQDWKSWMGEEVEVAQGVTLADVPALAPMPIPELRQIDLVRIKYEV